MTSDERCVVHRVVTRICKNVEVVSGQDAMGLDLLLHREDDDAGVGHGVQLLLPAHPRARGESDKSQRVCARGESGETSDGCVRERAREIDGNDRRPNVSVRGR